MQANAGAPPPCRPIRAASRFTSRCISYSRRPLTPGPTRRTSLFASHAHSACPPPRTVLAGVQNAADDGADRPPVPPTAVPPPGRPPPVRQRRRRHDDATGKPAWMHSFLILQHAGRRLTLRLPLRLFRAARHRGGRRGSEQPSGGGSRERWSGAQEPGQAAAECGGAAGHLTCSLCSGELR